MFFNLGFEFTEDSIVLYNKSLTKDREEDSLAPDYSEFYH